MNNHKKKSDQTTNDKEEQSAEGKKASGNLRRILSALTILGIVAVVILLSRVTPDENRSAEPAAPLRAIGPETAEVTITEFADFGCITCKAWHQFGVREEVLDHYGEQVRFVWRDFPVTTRYSAKAAEAGFCAQDQNRFWEYHHVLYENAPALAVDHLKVYAEEIGLNTSDFNQCLDSGKYQQAVENELDEAKELGLRGVPSFIVNGKRLVGPPSFEQLAATIDDLLASQE